MATSFGALCDDFYVNMYLNTELELPSERDTVLFFFDRIRRQFPSMNNFYQRETGEFCLDEDRETGTYRWVTLEKDRVSSGIVNPENLESADEQNRMILDIVPYLLGINSLDIDSLDVMFGMDFDYQGNHDEILAEALFQNSAFASLLEIPGAKALGFDPAILISLEDNCRLQAKISLESRTGAYQLRTGKFKEDDQLSLYLSIRQYPDPAGEFSCPACYDKQRQLCVELMSERVIPNFVNPILNVISQHR